MKALLNRWWPFLASAAACYPFWRWALPLIQADKLANVFAAVLNVSAIAAGFLGTALTLVLAMDAEPIMKALKESDTYSELTDYLLGAVRWCLFLAVLSCIALFVEYKTPTTFTKTMLTVWAGTLSATTISCYRVVALFSRILRLRHWGKR